MSRDPIRESGGINTYAFVENNPQNGVDVLGLAYCKCGKDITKLLTKAISEISNEFLAADKRKKKAICKRIISPHPSSINKGWDIDELAFKKTLFIGDGCGTGSCGIKSIKEGRGRRSSTVIGTVTVNGKCYRPAEVNYYLWGVANKLCFDVHGRSAGFYFGIFPYPGIHYDFIGRNTLAHARALVSLYRGVFYGGGVVAGRLAWTTAGYNGSMGGVPSDIEVQNCDPCLKDYTGSFNVNIGPPTSSHVKKTVSY